VSLNTAKNTTGSNFTVYLKIQGLQQQADKWAQAKVHSMFSSCRRSIWQVCFHSNFPPTTFFFYFRFKFTPSWIHAKLLKKRKATIVCAKNDFFMLSCSLFTPPQRTQGSKFIYKYKDFNNKGAQQTRDQFLT